MSIISVKNFSKSYGSVQAVKGISFEVEEGSLFAFLGPNGAGKSTTIEALTTLTKFSGGDVTINGFKLGRHDSEIRKCIGVVFQQGVLDHQMTVYENLVYRGKLYGFDDQKLKKRIEEVSEITDIKEFWGQKYGRMSGGQMRRVDIARAMIHTPKILFLDEPSTGVDPKTRMGIWNVINRMQKEMGMTVFLTTHYMDEVGDADKVVIISKGLIVDEGTPAELKAKYTKNHILFYDGDSTLAGDLKARGFAVEDRADVITVTTDTDVDALAILEEFKGRFAKFEVKMGTMDEMFVKLVALEEKQHV